MDPITGISKVEIEIHVKEKGKKSVIHDSASERYMTANEVQLLADLSGKFNVADWYGDFNLNQPMDLSPKSRRMITVMQKK
jgi:hypothetical protein